MVESQALELVSPGPLIPNDDDNDEDSSYDEDQEVALELYLGMTIGQDVKSRFQKMRLHHKNSRSRLRIALKQARAWQTKAYKAQEKIQELEKIQSLQSTKIKEMEAQIKELEDCHQKLGKWMELEPVDDDEIQRMKQDFQKRFHHLKVTGEGAKLEETPKLIKLDKPPPPPPPVSGANSVPIGAPIGARIGTPLTKRTQKKKAKEDKG